MTLIFDRSVHFDQLDWEYAYSQMVELLREPSEVYVSLNNDYLCDAGAAMP